MCEKNNNHMRKEIKHITSYKVLLLKLDSSKKDFNHSFENKNKIKKINFNFFFLILKILIYFLFLLNIFHSNEFYFSIVLLNFLEFFFKLDSLSLYVNKNLDDVIFKTSINLNFYHYIFLEFFGFNELGLIYDSFTFNYATIKGHNSREMKFAYSFCIMNGSFLFLIIEDILRILKVIIKFMRREEKRRATNFIWGGVAK